MHQWQKFESVFLLQHTPKLPYGVGKQYCRCERMSIEMCWVNWNIHCTSCVYYSSWKMSLVKGSFKIFMNAFVCKRNRVRSFVLSHCVMNLFDRIWQLSLIREIRHKIINCETILESGVRFYALINYTFQIFPHPYVKTKWGLELLVRIPVLLNRIYKFSGIQPTPY